MTKNFVWSAAFLATSLLSVAEVQALTVSPAGVLPADLSSGSVEAADAVLFTEQTGVTVADGDVTVDYVAGDNLSVGGSGTGVTNFASGLSLGAGTYDSFLIHFDPDGRSSTAGTFGFANEIVAIILSNGTGNTNTNPLDGLLNVSDAIFGATTYDTHFGRRTEDNDTFSLVDTNTISFVLTTNARHVDNIRVITAVSEVPIPAAGWMLLAGVGGLFAARRRKG